MPYIDFSNDDDSAIMGRLSIEIPDDADQTLAEMIVVDASARTDGGFRVGRISNGEAGSKIIFRFRPIARLSVEGAIRCEFEVRFVYQAARDAARQSVLIDRDPAGFGQPEAHGERRAPRVNHGNGQRCRARPFRIVAALCNPGGCLGASRQRHGPGQACRAPVRRSGPPLRRHDGR